MFWLDKAVFSFIKGMCVKVGAIFYLGPFEGAVILIGLGFYAYAFSKGSEKKGVAKK
ncbi:hypothetical protein [Clostridium thermarum]|uniref:hypothetical protein n=1 Tax=Clostridium thermarum TaxID=1716543 RepID=UPI0013CFDFCF|nr:hypothetical protein [Clostridium thermarum]